MSFWRRQAHAVSGSRLLMLLHYLLVLSALDGQAAHCGEQHDRDWEDQGRAHRAHEAVLEDLLGELLDLLRHLSGYARRCLHTASGLARPNLEAVLGRLPEAVHEPVAKLGWKLASAPGRLILDGNGQTVLQEGSYGGAGDDTPHLLDRAEDTGSDSCHLGLYVAHGQVVERGPGEAQADAGHDQARQKAPAPGVCTRDPVYVAHAQGEQGKPAHQDVLAAEAVGQPPCGPGDEHRDQGLREEGKPGLERAQAQHRLQIDGQRQEEAKHGEVRRRYHQGHQGVVSVPEDGEGHKRLPVLTQILSKQEDEHQDYACADDAWDSDEGDDFTPVVALALDEAEGDAEEARGGEQHAKHVEPVPATRMQVGHDIRG